MPQRYYFHLVGPTGMIADPLGVEAETVDQARTEAEAVVAEMRADGELPDPDGGWHIEIRNAAGALVGSIDLH
ncbi:DUF6894 family protein [Methylobacterium crusticola]|nr:hypothetical protein [Methylobacterium crusticola]